MDLQFLLVNLYYDFPQDGLSLEWLIVKGPLRSG